MVEVKKKDKETVQSLLYRFTRSVQKSGILTRAKKSRFKERPKSRTMQKKAALRREEKREQYKTLKKMGKIKSRPRR
ncbi:MAG: hypothetical protein US98_C0049G0004 [Parcubacteria group bacterium GW2011_GWC1_38_6]|nr:MAG: hypothetical protein US98_C0049G0004 [Parcubacteria group bacterium GW2011_GWC1_38_6]